MGGGKEGGGGEGERERRRDRKTEMPADAERNQDVPSILPVPTEAARRIYPWEFKPLFSYPWDHNWLKPAGTLHSNCSASQQVHISNPAHQTHCLEGGRTPNPSCKHPCVQERRAKRCVHGEPTSPHTRSSHYSLSPPGSPSPSPSARNRPGGAESPCWVPGMKSRAVVTEKTIQQAGWCILRLWCPRGWAGCRCCRCRLPLC